MIDGRRRIAGFLATLCIAALTGSMLTAPPSYATPDIDDAATNVEQLYREAEQASERYNEAREQLQHARTRLHALRADLRRQQAKVEGIRDQVAAAVVAQYQGEALSSTTRVVLSDDPAAFLDQLATVAEYNDQQSRMLVDFVTETKQLELREQAAERELARIASTEKQLAADKAEIDRKAGQAERLLDRLQGVQEARGTGAASRSDFRGPLPEVTASGGAAAAIRYALAQVGDSYLYGAAGPGAYDCSGLTMMAWAQAGVGLPHSSAAQTGSGTPVPTSALQPGDLVFYYSPVSHVGIYIGNGQIVHAANPSTGVRISPVFSMPVNGAVRL